MRATSSSARPAAALLLALLLAACDGGARHPAGFAPDDSDLLNNADAMLGDGGGNASGPAASE